MIFSLANYVSAGWSEAEVPTLSGFKSGRNEVETPITRGPRYNKNKDLGQVKFWARILFLCPVAPKYLAIYFFNSCKVFNICPNFDPT